MIRRHGPPKLWRRFDLVVLLGLCAVSLFPQQPITFQYIYDDLNQLVRVIDSTGVSIQYVYDPVGNNTQIIRSTVVPGALTIFNITPVTAPTGLTITIQGQGFSTTPSANVVTLNGIALTVVSATSTALVVLIPANATTGTISVTVGGVTATSSTPETILPAPIILTLAPKATLAGTPFTLAVMGANLTGATFAFSPLLTITSTSINAGGTSATLTVSPASSAMGYYTLIGTNVAGPSSAMPVVGFLPTVTAFNTISIPGSNPTADPDNDGLTNAQEIAIGTDPLNPDTDGDGYVDGIEVLLGSNPLNPKSIPILPASNGYLTSAAFSIENKVSPIPPSPQTYVISGLTFSILNSPVPPGPNTYVISGLPFSIGNKVSPLQTSPQTYVISGLTFSILNSPLPPGPNTYVISGLPFSMRNSVSPASGPQTYTISGLPFSIRNSISPATGPQSYTISGLPFSIRNSISPGTGPQSYTISGLPFSIRNSVSPASGPQSYTITGLRFSMFNGMPSGSFRPSLGAPSLSFRIPIDPKFLAEALARGAERFNGKPVCMDSDGDGICDADELLIGTNPFLADTDGDGYPDGLELLLGSDPLDSRSIPDIQPPGYYVTPPVSIQNINPVVRLTPRRQGAVNAKNNR